MGTPKATRKVAKSAKLEVREVTGDKLAPFVVERFAVAAGPVKPAKQAAAPAILPAGTFFFVRKAAEPPVEATGERHHYVATFSPAARLAWIDTLPDARAFAAKFAGPAVKDGPRGIRWADVARDFHGVIVTKTPAVANKEYETLGWFTAWDRPAACVWNPAALGTLAEEA